VWERDIKTTKGRGINRQKTREGERARACVCARARACARERQNDESERVLVGVFCPHTCRKRASERAHVQRESKRVFVHFSHHNRCNVRVSVCVVSVCDMMHKISPPVYVTFVCMYARACMLKDT